jgi:glycosyltransferase involved in cell wall biosynthesis
MSIVILTNIPTPYRTAFFDSLAAAAALAGKPFHVLYCAKTEPGRHWPYDPTKMRHAHTVMRGFHPSIAGIHAHFTLGVLAEIHRLKPDTLIIGGAWNTPTMLIAGLNFNTLCRRRLLWSEAHAGSALNKSGGVAWLRHRIYRRFQGFVVPNQSSMSWAISQAGEAKPCFLLPNSINAGFYERKSPAVRIEARRRLGLPEHGRVLVQIGLLASAKGAPELARTFLGVPVSERKNATLVLVGSGPAEEELRKLAVESAGTLRLLGQLPPEGVRDALWAADAFFLNTRRDSNPLSAIEAAAAGLPVVMSAAAGNIREVVEAPDAGYIIRDPDNPSEGLRAVLEASDTHLAEMGERAARQARAQFDAPAVARSLIDQLYPSV